MYRHHDWGDSRRDACMSYDPRQSTVAVLAVGKTCWQAFSSQGGEQSMG